MRPKYTTQEKHKIHLIMLGVFSSMEYSKANLKLAERIAVKIYKDVKNFL